MFAEDADAVGDGFVLHTLAGLAGAGGFSIGVGFGIGVGVGFGFAMGAKFGRGRGRLLGGQVGVNVDQLDGAGGGHTGRLAGVLADAVVAVGNQPAFRPEIAGGCCYELVQFAFVDFVAPSVVVQLAGLALDGNVSAIGTAHRYGVDAYVLAGDVGEMPFPFRPVGPGIALCDVPFPQVGGGFNGDGFQPFAVGGMRAHFVDDAEGVIQESGEVVVGVGGDDWGGSGHNFMFPCCSVARR